MIDFLKRLFLILKEKPVLENNNEKQNNNEDVKLESVSSIKKIIYICIFLVAAIFIGYLIYAIIQNFPNFVELVKSSFGSSKYLLNRITIR